ncbi:hypothetical protein ANN_00483 [Periplaneta americana]|uniref:Uncharacterized protein n=1 Tax=Periplaneta americana TaxID=6978 RepID=A0ABQ8TTB7_PERAM|nr:hypothetical protein ANN_00483 [Periplaneta americana]
MQEKEKWKTCQVNSFARAASVQFGKVRTVSIATTISSDFVAPGNVLYNSMNSRYKFLNPKQDHSLFYSEIDNILSLKKAEDCAVCVVVCVAFACSNMYQFVCATTIFYGRVTGDNYLQILMNEVVSQLQQQATRWSPSTLFKSSPSIKNKIYSRKLRRVGDLKNYIREAFQEINVERNLFRNVCRSVKYFKAV